MSSIIYSISYAEINRRTSAFTIFISSLFLGFILWPFLINLRLILNHVQFFVIFLVTLCVLLIAARQLLLMFFASLHQTQIILTGSILERKIFNTRSRYALRDVINIAPTKTVKNQIRRVNLLFADHRRLNLDGLDNFGHFLLKLSRLTHSPIKESRELIDYDHPGFYLVLGQLVSLTAVIFINLAVSISYSQLKLIYFSVAAYTFLLSLYFIFARPFIDRFGPKFARADYLCSALFIGTSLAICMLALLMRAG